MSESLRFSSDSFSIVFQGIVNKMTPNKKRTKCVKYYVIVDGKKYKSSFLSLDLKWMKPGFNAAQEWHLLIEESNNLEDVYRLLSCNPRTKKYDVITGASLNERVLEMVKDISFEESVLNS